MIDPRAWLVLEVTELRKLWASVICDIKYLVDILNSCGVVNTNWFYNNYFNISHFIIQPSRYNYPLLIVTVPFHNPVWSSDGAIKSFRIDWRLWYTISSTKVDIRIWPIFYLVKNCYFSYDSKCSRDGFAWELPRRLMLTW